jgi:hypothetical protein
MDNPNSVFELHDLVYIFYWFIGIVGTSVFVLYVIDLMQKGAENSFVIAAKYLEKQHERVNEGKKPENSYHIFSPLMTCLTYLFLLIIVLIGAAVFLILPLGGASIVGVAISLFIMMKKYATALKHNMKLDSFFTPDKEEIVKEVQKNLRKNMFGVN